MGVMGQVDPLVCPEFGLSGEVFTAELYVRTMMACVSPEPSYVPLPRFPAIMRDIAVICNVDIPAAELADNMKNAGGDYLENVKLFDVYTGTGIAEGKRSLAFSLSIRAKDKTLTDEHADEIVARILENLKKYHGAVLR